MSNSNNLTAEQAIAKMVSDKRNRIIQIMAHFDRIGGRNWVLVNPPIETARIYSDTTMYEIDIIGDSAKIRIRRGVVGKDTIEYATVTTKRAEQKYCNGHLQSCALFNNQLKHTSK